jgi:hypothetical protein
LNIDPGGHFLTLNIETRGVEFRPYPVENWAGPWNFDHKSVSKFNSIKTCNIYIPGLFNQKLNFIPVFTLLFVYFAFDSLCHKIPKSFDRSFPQQGLAFCRIVES